MVEPPASSDSWLVNSEISDFQRSSLSLFIVRIIGLVVMLIIVSQVFRFFLGVESLILTILCVLVLVVISTRFWKRELHRRRLMKLVNIGVGHPWHPSEATDQNKVWISDEDEWHEIPLKVRLFPQKDPLIQRTLLRKNDMDGQVLIRWGIEFDDDVRNVITLINQTLAYRDAQERTDGEIDAIENARERESGEFYPEERTWQETTPGSMAPQPGLLLRQLRGEKKDEK